MAEKKDAKKEPKKDDVTTPLREALEQGDASVARRLARAVLADPTAPDESKAAARDVLSSTEIDRQALLAGAIALAVLLFLFFLVFSGRF